MDRYPDGMGPMRARLGDDPGAACGLERRGRHAVSRSPAARSTCSRLLQGSLSLSEIAGELYVSTNTVKTHTQSLYRKLGASSRTEATRARLDMRSLIRPTTGASA